MRYSTIFAAVLAVATQAQTDEDKLAYPDYAAAFAHQNLTWEPVKVHTENGYTLTAFHITGDVDSGPFEITKSTVVMQHGMGGNGLGYLTDAWGPIHGERIPAMTVQLARMGYDIWI